MPPFRSHPLVGSWKVTFTLLPLGNLVYAFRNPLSVMKINRRRALKSTAAGVGALSMLPSDGLAAEAARPFGEDFPNLESLSTGPWWTRPANQTTPLKNGRRAAPPNLNVPRDQVVVFALYTHQANVLKLTAQLYPLLPEEAREARLELKLPGNHGRKWLDPKYTTRGGTCISASRDGTTVRTCLIGYGTEKKLSSKV